MTYGIDRTAIYGKLQPTDVVADETEVERLRRERGELVAAMKLMIQGRCECESCVIGRAALAKVS